ncbi:MAG: 8-oxo-dGTP diphosphatase MutT, partial [Balneolaceae bacterium]
GCPLRAGCTAYRQLKTDVLPYKSPTTKKPHYHIGVGIIENDDGRVLIALRQEEAMLGGMWEFPGGKQEEHEDIQKTVQRELREELGVDVAVKKSLMKLNHAYSHFSITLHAFICRIREGTPKPKSSQRIKWVTVPELNDYPFPKANRQLTEKLMELYENGDVKKPDGS